MERAPIAHAEFRVSTPISSVADEVRLDRLGGVLVGRPFGKSEANVIATVTGRRRHPIKKTSGHLTGIRGCASGERDDDRQTGDQGAERSERQHAGAGVAVALGGRLVVEAL